MTFAVAVNVRKATYADRFYLPGSPLYSKLWTPVLDDVLRDLCSQTYVKEVGRRMEISHEEVRQRVKLLGIKPLTVAESQAPTQGEWIGTVSRLAAEARLHPSLILAGSKGKCHSMVRAKAWRAILDENPHYTVAGVARISGHDHSTLCVALKKLGAATAVKDGHDGPSK